MSSLGFIATGAAQAAIEKHVPVLVADAVASRIASKDATLWGPAAQPEASIRLGWVDAAETSAALVPQIIALRDELRAEGVNRIVLAGMGGSSLAPEVIAATNDVELVVCDSTEPGNDRRHPGRPPGHHGPGGFLQVGIDGGNRFAAPGLRAGVFRRRARCRDAASSWSPTRAPRWTPPRVPPATVRCSTRTRTSAGATRR